MHDFAHRQYNRHMKESEIHDHLETNQVDQLDSRFSRHLRELLSLQSGAGIVEP